MANFLEDANNILYTITEVRNPIQKFLLKRKLLKLLNKWNSMSLLSVSDVKTFIKIFNTKYISNKYIFVDKNSIVLSDKRCVFDYTHMILYIRDSDKISIVCKNKSGQEDFYSCSIYDKEFNTMHYKVLFHAFCKAIQECMTEYINNILKIKGGKIQ